MEMKYNLTMQEAEDYVTVMRQIFDMVRMISLEGWSFTIKLYPHNARIMFRSRR